MKPSTIAIHVGNEPDRETGAVIAPIYQTSNFVTDKKGGQRYEYTRAGNPNFTRLEETLAALEGGLFATVFSSGLGALSAVLSDLKPGDEVLASEDLYGGTYRLITHLSGRVGIRARFVPAFDATAWKDAMEAKTRIVVIETPTNPLLQIADITAISSHAKRQGIPVVVDNTFATPILQQPLALGATMVLHSTTKYIAGHSDVIGGAVVTDNEEYKQRLDFARKAIGLNPSPFDSWLTSRGLKTLALRMERHTSNATTLATFLKSHPAVKQVIYPGLPDHPQHALASRQMSGFGGMIGIRVNGTKEKVEEAMSRLKIFTRAESLGGVESLISHPATQTHATLPQAERERRGIGDDLWRLSVGIEDSDDLKEDLKHALDSISD